MNTDALSPWIARGLYLFGIALMLTASIDLFTTVWPPRPSELAWRYGFFGLAAGYLQTPTLGIVIIGVAAVWQEHVQVLRIAAYGCLITAVVYFGIMGIFALDVLAMRELRDEEMQSAVLAGGMFQESKYFVAAVTFALLGYGGVRTARDLGTERARRAPGIVSNAK